MNIRLIEEKGTSVIIQNSQLICEKKDNIQNMSEPKKTTIFAKTHFELKDYQLNITMLYRVIQT